MTRRIYFYPFSLDANRYAQVQVSLLAGICRDVQPIHLRTLVAGFSARNESIAILNFYEDRLSYHQTRPTRTLLESIAMLLVLRLSCHRIIWVRHNFWPHDLPREYLRQRVLLFFLNVLADLTVTHRKVEQIRSVVIPHPLYFDGALPPSIRDIDFFFFGTIRRYKGLDELLSYWPRGHSLVIAGSAPDSEHFARLQAHVLARGLNVKFIPGYLPQAQLDALLLRTKYALLPHRDDAMIVAGTFYHAASMGANVLANDSSFSRYLQTEFSFVTVYTRDLRDVLTQLRYVEPTVVVEQLRAVNGPAACRRAWEQIVSAR